MRAERADVLASPVMRLEERVHAHGKIAPPNRIAQVDGLVRRDVDIAHVCGACTVVLLGKRYVAAFAIACRVRLRRNNLEQVGTGFIGNHLGDDRRVAFFDNADLIVLVCAREVDDEGV